MFGPETEVLLSQIIPLSHEMLYRRKWHYGWYNVTMTSLVKGRMRCCLKKPRPSLNVERKRGIGKGYVHELDGKKFTKFQIRKFQQFKAYSQLNSISVAYPSDTQTNVAACVTPWMPVLYCLICEPGQIADGSIYLLDRSVTNCRFHTFRSHPN